MPHALALKLFNAATIRAMYCCTASDGWRSLVALDVGSLGCTLLAGGCCDWSIGFLHLRGCARRFSAKGKKII